MGRIERALECLLQSRKSGMGKVNLSLPAHLLDLGYYGFTSDSLKKACFRDVLGALTLGVQF